jgi:hypothetical protein
MTSTNSGDDLLLTNVPVWGAGTAIRILGGVAMGISDTDLSYPMNGTDSEFIVRDNDVYTGAI